MFEPGRLPDGSGKKVALTPLGRRKRAVLDRRLCSEFASKVGGEGGIFSNPSFWGGERKKKKNFGSSFAYTGGTFQTVKFFYI